MRIWGKNMKNKLLICGGAIAVIILVLASLSPVVGYNSVESSAKDSPLFNVRAKRAINEDSDGLKCEYIGKGNTLSFPIPIRDSKTAKLQKVVDGISLMDDTEFNRLINLVINQMNHDNKLTKMNTRKVVIALHQLRDDPEVLMNYGFDEKMNNSYTILDGRWNPGCLILFISAIILAVILTIYETLGWFIETWAISCNGCTSQYRSILPRYLYRNI